MDTIDISKEDKEFKSYEVAFLVKTEEAAGGVFKLVESYGGEFMGEPQVRPMALAYEVGGVRQAYFCVCQTKLPIGEAKNLENSFRTHKEVLRFLVILLPKAAPAGKGRVRPVKPSVPEKKEPATLSNEALEKKIEEILQ